MDDIVENCERHCTLEVAEFQNSSLAFVRKVDVVAGIMLGSRNAAS